MTKQITNQTTGQLFSLSCKAAR